MVDYICEHAGKDPSDDRYKTGYMAACRDFLFIQLEEVEVD